MKKKKYLIPKKHNVLFKICCANLMLLLFIFSGCSKEPKAILKVKMENADKAMSYLVELTNDSDIKIDSARLNRNGNAKYSFPVSVPGYYQIKFENGQTLTLIISPKESITLTADYKDLYNTKKIEGSENSKKVNILHDSLRSTILKLDQIKKEFSKVTGEIKDSSKLSGLSDEFLATLEKQKHFSISFILNDLKSLANVAALFQEYSPGYYLFSEGRDLQFFKLVSDSLGKYYPDVRYVKILSQNYQKMFENYQAQRLLKMAKPGGNYLPDIKLPDKKGSIVNLSSLRGKIVLLSFWSIVNEDCVKFNDALFKVYKRFKSKDFEIYQVSIDNSRDEWLKAIKFDEIPWLSVNDTTFPNSNLAWAYNLNSLPMNYLISRDQTEIIGKNLNTTMLEQQLNELLKK